MPEDLVCESPSLQPGWLREGERHREEQQKEAYSKEIMLGWLLGQGAAGTGRMRLSPPRGHVSSLGPTCEVPLAAWLHLPRTGGSVLWLAEPTQDLLRQFPLSP